jgi:hypothetical protein
MGGVFCSESQRCAKHCVYQGEIPLSAKSAGISLSYFQWAILK